MSAPIRDVFGMPAVFYLHAPGTLSVGDDKCLITMPKCRVIWAVGTCEDLGGTSGEVELELENVTDSVPITDVLHIPHDGVDNKALPFTLKSDEAALYFDEGDLLGLNVDEIAGGNDSKDAWALVMAILLN